MTWPSAFIIFNKDVFLLSNLSWIIIFVTGCHHVRVFGGNLFYLLDTSFYHNVVRTLDDERL